MRIRKLIMHPVVDGGILCIAIAMVVAALFMNRSNANDTRSYEGSYASEDGRFVAEISEYEIKIYLGGDSLYWKGTWDTGKRITSQADTKMLDASLFGSQDSSKLFIVEDGRIAFDFTIMGTTSQVVLRKDS